MHRNKEDSFSPKRATNIDGFFAKPLDSHSRQPVFHTPAANFKHAPARLADMPRRSEPQNVLSSSSMAAAAQAPTYPLSGERPRRRNHNPLPPMMEPEKKARSPRSWRRIFKRSAAVLGVLVILCGAWYGFRFYRDIAKLTGNNNPLSLLGVFKPVALQNQSGRVNILVAGNSADDIGHNGGNLTDSIMVLSLNTKNNTALMLSIPRDLWVDIPSVGYGKINSAYPNGGMDLLQQVVQDNLGLTIDYHVLVNYQAFKDLVNAVGGITINIQSDDPRGIYDPNIDYTTRNCCALAKYPNGPAKLNGQQALNLARARGDPNPFGYPYGFTDGDFDRTEHQRQMLVSIKDKASTAAVIANPFKVASLVDAVGKNVKSNLQVNEIETMYTYMKKVDDTKIDSYNINTLKGKNTTMLANYTSPDGQSALIPAAGLDDFSDIQAQIQRVLTAGPLEKENAVAVVLNGTETVGLAQQQANTLTAKGMNVTVGDASATQATTTLIDNSNGQMPNTLAYFKKQYKATVTTDVTLTRTYPNADFILILGQSAVPKTTTPSQ
ncbi:MAG TPA: LCP family protein [Candidatus Saccharimonadales bacterium]|nr:LCP family protein [Candidatus Saccharimonadales bacterium]